MNKKERIEQLEKRFSEWLDKVLLPFYEKNVNNPKIIGEEMRFSIDNNLTSAHNDIKYSIESVFSDWLDKLLYEDLSENFQSSWAEDYKDISLEAFDVKLRDKDLEFLADMKNLDKELNLLEDPEYLIDYKNLLPYYECDCILKIIVPTYDIHEKEILVRFGTDFVSVEYDEPFYDQNNSWDDPFADHGSYEWDFINEKYYEGIKESLRALDYLDTPYNDRYYVCSSWEKPYIDDPKITKERITEETIIFSTDEDDNEYDEYDEYDEDDENEEDNEDEDEESIMDEIRDAVRDWFLRGSVMDKCDAIFSNLKNLEEDEVLKLKIISNEDFILDNDELEDILEEYRNDWWEDYEDNTLGVKDLDEDTAVWKSLDCPNLSYEYDEEKKILTIRAKFSVYYSGSWDMDEDVAEKYYVSDDYDYTDDDEGTPEIWYMDDYGSEDAFWESNGL